MHVLWDIYHRIDIGNVLSGLVLGALMGAGVIGLTKRAGRWLEGALHRHAEHTAEHLHRLREREKETPNA